MGFNIEAMAAHAVNTFAKGQARLASYIRRLIEARRRRIEQDREFYQKLKAYCRNNNLSSVCEDDWKTRS
jgi:lipoate synthase